ncbi:MAG TPA: DUF4097 family beta strand repeat-containing protein [Gemmatimonadaceae bacterium]|nr:DUF4097 family beta strand repeat-containing protein [Gemmatimonadaceae bacterium]
MKLTPLITVLALGAAIALPAHAQQDRVDRWLEHCRQNGWSSDSNRGRVCDVKKFTIEHPAGSIHVDASPNGGVSVFGWNKPAMLVVAKIQTMGDDDADAKDIAGRITIDVSSARVQSDGPSTHRHQGWSVGYDIYVPVKTGLDVNTENGGVTVEKLVGRLDLSTQNGGIHLTDVGGDVRAETTNGGVSATLTGATWQGGGLDLRTTNGGVTLAIPRDYNARLEIGTTNGGLDIDFPITVQGRLGRRINTTLGKGGPLIRATTVNGGVRVRSN